MTARETMQELIFSKTFFYIELLKSLIQEDFYYPT